ncbi:MAG: hypothetical protein WDO69_27045 [Pseudomonadota bacterium]
MKASDLASKHQGPSDCEARCVELGMRMGALVLVSDDMPGCVCQPKPPASELPKPIPGEAPNPDASKQGASAATVSYVVAMAAAAASRAAQAQRQQHQQQQSYNPK